ncbi:hypothetical protein DSO57_1035044 [Entomophthora muscae]|uniref:Uncharacterized protein n=1 Tax=Entomophthora muscae TaxID=34485 RepID=A0ACC2TXH7_9FUNG|nr:hypothetical protein DSO57_1035044 [Entomophthora muscae]
MLGLLAHMAHLMEKAPPFKDTAPSPNLIHGLDARPSNQAYPPIWGSYPFQLSVGVQPEPSTEVFQSYWPGHRSVVGC